MSNLGLIYVIDDDEVFGNVLTRSLSRLNYQAEHFLTPQQALPKIESNKEITILLDLNLKNDSGLRWIKNIRMRNMDCQIVLLTGYASIATAVEAIKLGANDYLTKPITAREIIQHLQSSVGELEMLTNNTPMSVERLEWEHIQKVLMDHDGNISASARSLRMHRRTLQRKLSKKPARR
ncbi:MAG: response regulator [Kangiellaceae bacterium]|nr:response regulator [Kangiellaceae bacterium]